MVRRPSGCVVSICVVLCLASGAAPNALSQRQFVIREKPYLANRLPLIPSRDAAVAPSTTKHCVWRVTNLSVPFYLVGTIHSLRPADYPLAEVYHRALSDSKRLLFEYNPKEHLTYERKFAAAGRYPEGKDIRSDIRPETLALLMRNLNTFHVRFDDIKKYKPWALVFRLWSIKGYAATAGTLSVDGYLSYQAQRLRKDIAGLETVDEHIAFLQNTLQFDSERLLVETIVGGKRLSDRSDETRQAWKRGDIAALAAINASLRKESRQTAQRLLDERNLKWLPRIEAEMRTGTPTAIVAGAGHFSGAYSVVDLLQQRGYKIEQL